MIHERKNPITKGPINLNFSGSQTFSLEKKFSKFSSYYDDDPNSPDINDIN